MGDYDNDGHPDMLVTYYGHNILYRNLGNGKFADITAAARLPATGTRWGTGCALLDYDRDGYVDLFRRELRGSGFEQDAARRRTIRIVFGKACR